MRTARAPRVRLLLRRGRLLHPQMVCRCPRISRRISLTSIGSCVAGFADLLKLRGISKCPQASLLRSFWPLRRRSVFKQPPLCHPAFTSSVVTRRSSLLCLPFASCDLARISASIAEIQRSSGTAEVGAHFVIAVDRFAVLFVTVSPPWQWDHHVVEVCFLFFFWRTHLVWSSPRQWGRTKSGSGATRCCSLWVRLCSSLNFGSGYLWKVSCCAAHPHQ